MSKTVNVLISTYNGEAYIEQQIDSILGQTYPDIHIYIRDDGSKDSTIERIKKYLSDSRVTLIEGENIGYARSFMALLAYADSNGYYAFCDQDDVWFPDKISWAMNWLTNQNAEVPCLFHSAYENVDERLEHLSYYSVPNYEYDFRRALTECLYFGFSMVFNGKLRELMLLAELDNIDSHDWWATLIAVEFGECVFDSRIASQHRRHEKSVTLKSNQRKIEWLIESLKKGNKVRNNASEFERVFKDKINKKDRKVLGLFVDSGFFVDLFKAFYPKRWRPTWDSELALRFLMLIGKS